MRKNISVLYQKALAACNMKKLGDFMCKRLEELNGLSAEYILKKSGQLENVPVDLEKVIETINVYKHPRTFSDLEELQKREIAGLVLLDGDDVGIFYDIDAPLPKKRFIIAHEIGHCCLHGESLKNGYIEFLAKDGFENEHEVEASVFAARLLIPEQALKDVCRKLLLPSLDALADIFEVPTKLMRYRLEELNMKYYTIKGDRFIES